jgi:hypothetical protein
LPPNAKDEEAVVVLFSLAVTFELEIVVLLLGLDGLLVELPPNKPGLVEFLL